MELKICRAAYEMAAYFGCYPLDPAADMDVEVHIVSCASGCEDAE